MPFVSAFRPSIQLGLLKALALHHGFDATTVYPNLYFAKLIGLRLYEALCQHRGVLLGDWLFANVAFGETSPDMSGQLLLNSDSGKKAIHDLKTTPEQLLHIRNNVARQFLKSLLDLLPWSQFDVVGFTTTFEQNVSSIAFARLLKAHSKSVRVVFGGANVEGDMGVELFRRVPEIDHVVSGEAEYSFPALLQSISNNSTVESAISGVLTRHPTTFRSAAPTPICLDEIPSPDYSDYFATVNALALFPTLTRGTVSLPIETSRGCWWGAKHHCTFCGLNGATMTFRSKSPARVLEELTYLAAQHSTYHFEAVDNILDNRFFSTLLPSLVEQSCDYRFFFEVKANLNRAQIGALAQAGINRIQPGIESLSSRVLALMKKGTTALQNINALRWCHYYGVAPLWNMLWGFPGESEGDYAQQCELLPLLWHLQPPTGSGRLWLERFSPYYYDRQRFPMEYVKPLECYNYIYPDSFDRDAIAYFFDYRFSMHTDDSRYEPFCKEIAQWQLAWRRPTGPSLKYWYSPQKLVIDDNRIVDKPRVSSYDAIGATIYQAASQQPSSMAALHRLLDPTGSVVSRPTVQCFLDEFCKTGVMYSDDGKYLSLALPASSNRT